MSAGAVLLCRKVSIPAVRQKESPVYAAPFPDTPDIPLPETRIPFPDTPQTRRPESDSTPLYTKFLYPLFSCRSCFSERTFSVSACNPHGCLPRRIAAQAGLHSDPRRSASKQRIRKDVRGGVSGRGCGGNDKTPRGSSHGVLSLNRNRRNRRIEFWLHGQGSNLQPAG